MREIPLSRGLVALVDDEDYGRISSAGSWHALPNGRTHYARRNYWQEARCFTVLMPALITGLTYVDHANGDGLDNRRENLREASHGQNMANKRLYRNNTSGYKGISWQNNRRRWQARIWVAGRFKSLGTYSLPEDAARAYDAAALRYFGEFARLNFPQENQ